MKKLLYLILSCAVLLSSCNFGLRLTDETVDDETKPVIKNETKPTETSAPVDETASESEEETETEPDTTSAIVTTDPFTEADWLQVLEDKTMFYDASVKRNVELKAMTLTDYLRSRTVEHFVSKYSLVDMDSDGEREMVLWLERENDEWAGFILLHHEADKIYGFSFPYRGFYLLKEDGTYQYSGGVADNGTARITEFSGREYEEEDVLFCRHVEHKPINGYTTTTVFFSGNKIITKDEFDALYEKQNAKPDAVWVDYTVKADDCFSTDD